MSDLGTPEDFWNDRASGWAAYKEPLRPSQQDIAFYEAHMVDGGDTLILGATPELALAACGISRAVTAVDFAEKVIAELRLDRGVEYICEEWGTYFRNNPTKQFDTIMADGSPMAWEYPDEWESMALALCRALKPGGKFSARIYTNIDRPPQETYINPMLEKFVPSMRMATVESSWMVHPKHGYYQNYAMRYAFPPEIEIRRVFEQVGGLTLVGHMVPDTEEGERFALYAWKRPV